MPLLTVRCPSCSSTRDYLSPRESVPVCCGATMVKAVALPGVGRVAGTATPGGIRVVRDARDGFTTTFESASFVVREKGNALTRADYLCTGEDAHSFGDDYSGEPPVNPACPVCDAPSKKIVTASDIDRFLKDHPFGYNDPGLGRFIRDRAHWEEVKRELGVIDGDFRGAWNKQMADDAAMAEREDEDVRKMLASYVSGPDAAVMHRMADESPELDWRPMARQLGVLRD